MINEFQKAFGEETSDKGKSTKMELRESEGMSSKEQLEFWMSFKFDTREIKRMEQLRKVVGG